MPDSPPESTSRPFGRYLIRERIARGGMGEVFRALAVGADGFEKAVVVKRLLPKFAGRSDLADLFSAEAKLMTRLVHPNIVQVIDFGRSESDDCFLVMELVSGVDLRRFSRWHEERGEHVSPPVALFVLSQVLRGLAYAHGTFSADGARLVHRDISPGNVLLSTFGEVKVADFGVALVIQRADGALVSPDLIAGKPGYIAPEQWSGHPVDERADLYSLGALAFEIITGGLPLFDQDKGEQRLSETSRQGLAKVAPEPIGPIIARALAYRPEDRFPDARSMAQAIARVASAQSLTATPDDLADLVARAASELPAESQRVIVLSDDRARPVGEILGTILTRSKRAGLDRFTVRMTRGEEPPEVDDGEAEVSSDQGSPPPTTAPSPDDVAPEPAPALTAETVEGLESFRAADVPAVRRRARTLGLVALLVTVLLLGLPRFARLVDPSSGATRANREDDEAARRDAASPAGSAASREARLAAALERPTGGSNDVEELDAGEVSARANASAAAAGTGATAAATLATPTRARIDAARAPRPADHAISAMSPSVDCRGQLNAYATHGWIVRGGPEVVQAPGKYDWPCGTYALTAVSRVDPRDRRSSTLSVRPGVPSVLDLR